MTKADLYKRRNKNKQQHSSESEASTSEQTHETDPIIITINNLNMKNRAHKNSIENDVELIKANTQDTPVDEESEPNYKDIDEVPSVKPVEKTYGKSRSKLDDYMYVESNQSLDDIDESYSKATRNKKSKDVESPVPAKKRKIETRQMKRDSERQLRKKDDQVNGTQKGRRSDRKDVKNTPRQTRGKKTSSGKSIEIEKKAKANKVKTEKESIVENGTSRALRSNSGGGDKSKVNEKKTRATKESIENEKVSRTVRKRKFEETVKPVLRETGQNGRASRKSEENPERKIVHARKTKAALKELQPLILEIDTNVRMTRSRRRRMEISLSPSQVKAVMPAFSFESDVRVDSIESNKSAKTTRNTKGKRTASKAKIAPIRATRSRANRR